MHNGADHPPADAQAMKRGVDSNIKEGGGLHEGDEIGCKQGYKCGGAIRVG